MTMKNLVEMLQKSTHGRVVLQFGKLYITALNEHEQGYDPETLLDLINKEQKNGL